MGGEFKVAITKEDLVFAAAHFITFAGHRCEKLHGHNYRASLFVEGGLDAGSWFVVDFSAVKKIMRALTAELDHRVLLPRDNPKLAISEQNGSVHVAFAGEPRYRFPAGDCVILPIPNTTVERPSAGYHGRNDDEECRARGWQPDGTFADPRRPRLHPRRTPLTTAFQEKGDLKKCGTASSSV